MWLEMNILSSITHFWSRKSIFRAPPQPYPVSYNLVFDSNGFCPFGYCFNLTIKLNAMIGARVPALRLACRPSNIPRLVSSVVVDSVDGVLVGWDWARAKFFVHMRFKNREVVPLQAHFNPPVEIAMSLFIARVASSFHIGPPRMKIYSFLGVFAAPVFCESGSRCFRSPASTAKDFFNMIPRNAFGFSACAFTYPF